MFFKRIFLTICFVLLFLIPSIQKVLANTVYPYKIERIISNQERTKEIVSFRNDEKKDIYISPLVYSYNPQTLEITTTQSYIFVRADIDVFKVEPNEVLKLNYEIVPPLNIEPGTYFNLIVFRTEQEDPFIQQDNPIEITNNLSHLVVLHITDSESEVEGITTEFAQISLQIVEKGIPFIRPTRIKYIYQNITNYVLNPKGEIQIFSKKGKYVPIYLKINSKEEKLYPGGIIEEEFEIDRYDITDIYTQRAAIGRFYNGIDENVILKETTLEPNYTILVLGTAILIALIVLIKAIVQDRKRSKKKSA